MKNHLFNMHHKIKLQLDAICQEAGDMNVEEFMQVYEDLRKTKQDDKPSFVKNLWSRNPQKVITNTLGGVLSSSLVKERCDACLF